MQLLRYTKVQIGVIIHDATDSTTCQDKSSFTLGDNYSEFSPNSTAETICYCLHCKNGKHVNMWNRSKIRDILLNGQSPSVNKQMKSIQLDMLVFVLLLILLPRQLHSHI